MVIMINDLDLKQVRRSYTVNDPDVLKIEETTITYSSEHIADVRIVIDNGKTFKIERVFSGRFGVDEYVRLWVEGASISFPVKAFFTIEFI